MSSLRRRQPIRRRAWSRRSRVASASLSRSRCCSITSAGARDTKSALASFCAAALDLGRQLADLPLQAGALGCEVDDFADGQGEGGLVDHHHQRLRRELAILADDLADARQPLDGLAVTLQPVARGGRGALLVQRKPGAGRDVELAAGGTDGADQADQPAELSLGRGIDQFAAQPRPCGVDQQAGRALEQLPPQLFGDEGGDRMQEMQRLRQCPGGRGSGLALRGRVLAQQQRLGELDIPVAVGGPQEMVQSQGRLVEAIGLERRGHGSGGLAGLADDPAVEGLAAAGGVEVRTQRRLVHLHESGGVPELGDEVAVAFDPGGAELDVAALRGRGQQGQTQCVGAVVVDHLQGVDHIALGLGHLGAALVADQAVDVDVLERHLAREMQPQHHHAGDPEEDDVEAGDQDRGRVEAFAARACGRASPGSRTATGPRRTRCRARPRRGAAAPPAHSGRGRRRPPRPRSPRRTHGRPGHTRPGSDGPTRAGARCTRAGCCASTRNRCSPTGAARSACARPRPRRWRAEPASWRRSTTGRSGMARAACRSGRRAGRCGGASRPGRAGPAPRDSATTRRRASNRSRPR